MEKEVLGKMEIRAYTMVENREYKMVEKGASEREYRKPLVIHIYNKVATSLKFHKS